KESHVRAKPRNGCAQVLSHRERRRRREDLILLHVLHEEAACEVEGEHQIEHRAGPQPAMELPVEEHGKQNEARFDERLVDLGGVQRLRQVVAREDDSPRKIGHPTVDFRVEEIADTDRRDRPRGSYDYGISKLVEIFLFALAKEPKTQHCAEATTMARKP